MQEIADKKMDEAYRKIITDRHLQYKLANAFDKSFFTIVRWAKEKNDILTSIKALKIIGEFIEVEK